VRIKAGKSYSHFILVLTGIILISLGCAKAVRPPGGPEDKTPPQIFRTDPISGSTRVPLDSPIIIEFSESIDRQTASKALFISPLPEPEPKVKIKSRSIEIIPREDLQPDKTYVITIGTDLKDAHRVNLEQSVSFAFSTGAIIDSGSISGAVYKNGRGVAGISLALFEDGPASWGIPIDSLKPGYITQTGEGGLYTFDYLPTDTFYLVAFEDKNKNRRINAGREMAGVPFSNTEINTIIPMLNDIDIQLHKFDTLTISLRSVSVNPDRLLKVRFSKPLDQSQADNLISLAALTQEDDVAEVKIIDYTSLSSYPASDFILLTESLTAESSYQISFDLRPLYPDIDDSARMLLYSFVVPKREDQAPPVLLESKPADKAVNVIPVSSFLFRFSEMIRADSSSVWLVNTAEESSLVSLTMKDSFTYEGNTISDLDYGSKYKLHITGRMFRDAAGNRLSDSVVSIEFATIGQDTLGLLSGEVTFTSSEDIAYPVVISLNPVGEGEAKQITLAAAQDQFMTNLLPGYYTISAFLDRNANGEFDNGSIIPYQLAEPFTAAADTFRVRTRFESAGVLLEF
jgi:uncharacterized protein (DUF2141 family)